MPERLRIVDFVLVLAPFFGAVHGEIRIPATMVRGIQPMVRKNGDTDAAAGKQFVTFNLEGLIQCVKNALRQLLRLRGIRYLMYHDRELVSANSGQCVEFA